MTTRSLSLTSTGLPPALETAEQRLPASEIRGLSALLVAAFIAALVVVADALIDSYADGHLLAAWVLLWAVVFAALAVSVNPARRAASHVAQVRILWTTRRARRHADAYLRALAAHDPRIGAELEAAATRAIAARQAMSQAMGRAWLARHPVGTFNAAYQGGRNRFRTTPLAGLPTHLQYLQE